MTFTNEQLTEIVGKLQEGMALLRKIADEDDKQLANLDTRVAKLAASISGLTDNLTTVINLVAELEQRIAKLEAMAPRLK